MGLNRDPTYTTWTPCTPVKYYTGPNPFFYYGLINKIFKGISKLFSVLTILPKNLWMAERRSSSNFCSTLETIWIKLKNYLHVTNVWWGSYAFKLRITTVNHFSKKYVYKPLLISTKMFTADFYHTLPSFPLFCLIFSQILSTMWYQFPYITLLPIAMIVNVSDEHTKKYMQMYWTVKND